jgi:Tol biopolymer transport system component
MQQQAGCVEMAGRVVASAGRMTALIALVAGLGGCASMQATWRSVWQPRPAPQAVPAPGPESPDHEATSRALMASAKSSGINMFGEVGGEPGSAYASRSAVPLQRHTFTEEGRDFDGDLDRKGERLVFASTRHSENSNLYLKTVSGVSVTQLTSDPSSDVSPAFSPDGRMVAFSSDRGGTWDIWLLDLAGGQPVQVTNTPADELHPSWSPDGRRLVYSSLSPGGGQWELWISDAEAGASRKFIGYGLFPEWHPSGDTILFQRARQRGSRWFSIWTVSLLNDEPRFPVEVASSASFAMILPTWSDDGQWIAFTTVEPATSMESDTFETVTSSDIWMMRADGRSRTRLTDGYGTNTSPAFAPDGRVFFTTDRTGVDNIWSAVPTSGGETTMMTGAPAAPDTMAATVVPDSASEGSNP